MTSVTDQHTLTRGGDGSARIGVPNVDTETLTKHLQDIEVGQVVTYETLTGLLGRDVRKHCRGSLRSARRVVERDHHIHFETVIGVGLKRVTDSEAVKAASRYRRRASSAARRGAQKLSNVEFDALTNEQRLAHNALGSQMLAIMALASSSATKKIEHKVTVESGRLAIGNTLSLFTNGKE